MGQKKQNTTEVFKNIALNSLVSGWC